MFLYIFLLIWTVICIFSYFKTNNFEFQSVLVMEFCRILFATIYFYYFHVLNDEFDFRYKIQYNRCAGTVEKIQILFRQFWMSIVRIKVTILSVWFFLWTNLNDQITKLKAIETIVRLKDWNWMQLVFFCSVYIFKQHHTQNKNSWWNFQNWFLGK